MDAYTMHFTNGKMIISHSTGVVNEYGIEHLQEWKQKIVVESSTNTSDLEYVNSLIEQTEQSKKDTRHI